MRRIVRTVAAGIVIILGLALMSAAAFNPETGRISLPSVKDEPKEDASTKAIPPFNPESGVSKRAGVISQTLRRSSFDSEFGKRGKHEVEVSVIGADQYAIAWRDKPEDEWGPGSVRRTRTINSGFPVVQVAVNGAGRAATCVITIDGREKDRQSSSSDEPVVFCEA